MRCTVALLLGHAAAEALTPPKPGPARSGISAASVNQAAASSTMKLASVEEVLAVISTGLLRGGEGFLKKRRWKRKLFTYSISRSSINGYLFKNRVSAMIQDQFSNNVFFQRNAINKMNFHRTVHSRAGSTPTPTAFRMHTDITN